jgi:hypothetical protein
MHVRSLRAVGLSSTENFTRDGRHLTDPQGEETLYQSWNYPRKLRDLLACSRRNRRVSEGTGIGGGRPNQALVQLVWVYGIGHLARAPSTTPRRRVKARPSAIMPTPSTR